MVSISAEKLDLQIGFTFTFQFTQCPHLRSSLLSAHIYVSLLRTHIYVPVYFLSTFMFLFTLCPQCVARKSERMFGTFAIVVFHYLDEK